MIEPFRIDVPDDVLLDLDERLRRTRLPAELPGIGWRQGMSRALMVDLLDHWRDGYDWRAAEAELNRHPQFIANLDGARVHFQHVRSRHPEARPLMLTHGWPGSFHEFHKLIDRLVDPTAHGGEASDAFHLVIPSVMGFGFGGVPTETGWDARKIGALHARLMAELTYGRYFAHGTDWGSFITSFMAEGDPDHCAAIHITSPWAAPNPAQMVFAPFQKEAREFAKQAMAMFKEELGYRQQQASKPQTLGFALNDSPAGLAAWIVEKYQAWTDCDGDVLTRLSRDELLTIVMIYWVTGTITSSTRIYWEAAHGRGNAMIPEVKVGQPTGCVIFPKDVLQAPRSWAQNAWNVQRWTEMPRGGHFSALEEPGLLVDDLRSFFRGR